MVDLIDTSLTDIIAIEDLVSLWNVFVVTLDAVQFVASMSISAPSSEVHLIRVTIKMIHSDTFQRKRSWQGFSSFLESVPCEHVYSKLITDFLSKQLQSELESSPGPCLMESVPFSPHQHKCSWYDQIPLDILKKSLYVPFQVTLLRKRSFSIAHNVFVCQRFAPRDLDAKELPLKISI